MFLVETLLFYLFATLILVGALGVITGRNPVYSVLFLILSFLNGAGLFLLLKAELLAMLLVIVYVGAVAVLFLFVVMMLDVHFQELRTGMAKYVPFGLLTGAIVALELSALGFLWGKSGEYQTLQMPSQSPQENPLTNAELIGRLLYTDYFLIFQLAGIILLVAMIGAIVLTLRKRETMRHQNIKRQLDRTPADTLTLHKIESGKGVTL
jgi:NADH-quinone oxidoreductase subunit J